MSPAPPVPEPRLIACPSCDDARTLKVPPNRRLRCPKCRTQYLAPALGVDVGIPLAEPDPEPEPAVDPEPVGSLGPAVIHPDKPPTITPAPPPPVGVQVEPEPEPQVEPEPVVEPEPTPSPTTPKRHGRHRRPLLRSRGQ